MTRRPAPHPTDHSPWPHRWALALASLTFPLLWVGGLVTTTDAGMAVPDWPNTYGYNMFAYPLESWLYKGWDLFIEHGHRLLASLVGLVTIGLVIIVWRRDNRRWLKWLALLALAMVIAQGGLGGLRVLMNERQLAMAHGCFGPLFFALTAVLAAATSRAWRRGAESGDRRTAGLLVALAALAYAQLVLGAQLRHMPATASPWAFAALVKLHLGLAAVVAAQTLWVGWRAARRRAGSGPVRWIPAALVLVVAAQAALGAGTWLVKYGAPGWAAGLAPDNMVTNVADGWAPTHVVTAHSAGGSLIVALAAAAAAYAIRLSPPPSTETPRAVPTGATTA